MIIGAHAILYSTNADADRGFLQKVLELPSVDVGHGWLIFGLPPSEVAVHPSDGGDRHELYLMVDDVNKFVAEMKAKGHACDDVSSQRWGMLTAVRLPSGAKLGVYQPSHARPADKPAPKPSKKKAAVRPSARKAAPRAKRR